MKYTDSHEWILVQENVGIVGISKHAQKELGEVVYIQLPMQGQAVKARTEIAVLESTKAAADIYSPVSGVIIAVNQKVQEDPSLLNLHPEEHGWLFKISLSDPSELDHLLNQAEYLQLISG